MRKVGIGIIGCGVISTAYLKAAQRFPVIELKAVADMRSDAAERRGAEFGVPAMRVDQLLKRDDVEIVDQPHRAARPHRRQPGRAQRRQACAFGKAARHQRRRGAQGDGPRGAEESARRLRAGHVPRRRPPDRAQADRRRRDRHAGRRQRLLHVPGPRALAPGARLLLFARRRADARHGAVLHHRSRAAARPGRERDGLDRAAEVRTAGDQRADERHADSRSRCRPMSPARWNSRAARSSRSP